MFCLLRGVGTADFILVGAGILLNLKMMRKGCVRDMLLELPKRLGLSGLFPKLVPGAQLINTSAAAKRSSGKWPRQNLTVNTLNKVTEDD